MSTSNRASTNNGRIINSEKAALDTVLRQHAEDQYAEELAELAKEDSRQHPPNWVLSPWAVRTYLMGGKLSNGFVVSPKYIGNARLIEIAVATLATDRALLLYGLPGTAKSWVSEHLAVAVTGDSTLMIQGTAGTDENAIRYGWNYARLLVEGPSPAALVVSPMMQAMQTGKIARLEELTRRYRRAKVSTSSPPPTTATKGSMNSPAPSCAASTPLCCHCRQPWKKRSILSISVLPVWAKPLRFPRKNQP